MNPIRIQASCPCRARTALDSAWSELWGVVGLAAIAAGALLACRLRTRARPIVPLDLLRFPILRGAYAASIAAFAAQMCLVVALPFALEDGHGLAASQGGLLILPFPIGVGIASSLADASLTDSGPPR